MEKGASGVNNDNRVTNKHNETRSRLIAKLLPYVRKNGFLSIRMDEIAKIMDVSRATLYKYFSTKEEIIGYLVDFCVEYLNELIVDSPDIDQRFGTRFQQIFEQSVLLIDTDVFLKELENSYPELYERLRESMKQREQQVLAFYEDGMRRGIFNEINAKLLIKQDELLRSIFEVKYLMENQLTVHQVLYDYYKLKKIQLFKPEKLQAVDDSMMISKIEYFAQKITKNLY